MTTIPEDADEESVYAILKAHNKERTDKSRKEE